VKLISMNALRIRARTVASASMESIIIHADVIELGESLLSIVLKLDFKQNCNLYVICNVYIMS